MLQMVILSGGLATRLGSLARHIPKYLIPVKGKPFLEWQIELLQRAGFEHVLLLIGHLGKQIEEYVASRRFSGLEIIFGREPEGQLLGTGGALKWSEAKLEKEFFLMYGDSYLPIDYRRVEKFYFDKGHRPVMTVYRNEGKFDKSNVAIAEGKVIDYRKSGDLCDFKYIDYGLLVLQRQSLANHVCGEKFDLMILLQDLISRERLLAYEVEQRFYQTGTVSGIKEMEGFLDETQSTIR